MITYEQKREVLCNLSELYLNTRKNSYISVNDGIMNSCDYYSAWFLILMALTFPKEEAPNIFSKDFDISYEKQCFFVEKEYKKVRSSKLDKIKIGKIILEDARDYYDKEFGHFDEMNISEVANSLNNQGINI